MSVRLLEGVLMTVCIFMHRICCVCVWHVNICFYICLLDRYQYVPNKGKDVN